MIAEQYNLDIEPPILEKVEDPNTHLISKNLKIKVYVNARINYYKPVDIFGKRKVEPFIIDVRGPIPKIGKIILDKILELPYAGEFNIQVIK